MSWNWHYNEVVVGGNATARVKSFFPERGLIVLYDVQGEFLPGMEIYGRDSGTRYILNSFVIDIDYDLNYEPEFWEELLERTIYDGTGELVALEEHFTGLPTQDEQTTYLVVEY